MTEYDVRYAIGQQEVKGYDTGQLREAFLAEKLMQAGKVYWVYSHYERFMLGSAVPLATPLSLESIDPLKADFFLARRELGVINVGGDGYVIADGEHFELAREEALYLGQGNKEVSFHSMDKDKPARFYLNSAPAHHAYPNCKIGKQDANVLHLGSQATSNERDINQLIINKVVQTCQLQMGLTRLKSGSVWNTMPAHQHDRRNEVYFYFDLEAEQGICHFMGEPRQTRHIWVANEQAVLSPPWSIHCGVGTGSYAFIWGMAGENLDYDDMDKYPPDQLR
ncbi:5-dehydro-4-deoxy-D-glucuronate isomerase [Lacimicrobium alkaliphilum]|uniref:4-deoxy-L-threo-5-hexosulose-uronate ketol-isomerase n=1 Tax=Lacimicrobium alkaliphilum TaxID=1526571 RepID=A0A0U3AT95_9ALTE|nr:5-dehydro-4-deoxy-D-glucuronate isomerase [Lacimicrobium alkaliphilum]ALS97311.1 5-keto-4-deoxyuronate isomerase [Lacimicrobium alkaliphilum]